LFRAFTCAVKGKNMGMPSAQVQAGTQPQMGQFAQAGQFTTGMGSGPPTVPVPLNLPLNPVAGQAGSPEAIAAAWAKQNAELAARKARREANSLIDDGGSTSRFALSGNTASTPDNPHGVVYYDTTDPTYTGPGTGRMPTTPTTNFTTGGGSPEVRTMAGPQPQNQVVPQAGPSPTPQAGPSPTPQNQTAPMTQSKGKGGSTTNAATSGQPAFGQPNRYPNTVGQWDNASIQRTNRQPMAGGKGKG
jgi:hypothetical protein